MPAQAFAAAIGASDEADCRLAWRCEHHKTYLACHRPTPEAQSYAIRNQIDVHSQAQVLKTDVPLSRLAPLIPPAVRTRLLTTCKIVAYLKLPPMLPSLCCNRLSWVLSHTAPLGPQDLAFC